MLGISLTKIYHIGYLVPDLKDGTDLAYSQTKVAAGHNYISWILILVMQEGKEKLDKEECEITF